MRGVSLLPCDFAFPASRADRNSAMCRQSARRISVTDHQDIPRMSDPYFQALFAERIGGVNYGKGTEIYKFEKIKRAKRKALADYPNRSLIYFGIGENDGLAPESVR